MPHFYAKLGDFGFSGEMSKVVDRKTLVTAPGFCQSEGYYPPELSQGQCSKKSDVYSYGVVHMISLLQNFLCLILCVYTGCTRNIL